MLKYNINMKKVINIVLLICILALLVVIVAGVYFVSRDNRSQSPASLTQPVETLSENIETADDLVKSLNTQASEEITYYESLSNELNLLIEDATELSNIMEAYDENAF